MNRHLNDGKEACFPQLRKEDYRVTSDEDTAYNCIAHAADQQDAWWWPEEEEIEGVYWPNGIPRQVTLDAFIAAFAQLGYEKCDNTEPEVGFEKVVLYIDANGQPTHAAKQLDTGAWSSKLGDWEDIQHETLEGLNGLAEEGKGYGRPAQAMRRPIVKSGLQEE